MGMLILFVLIVASHVAAYWLGRGDEQTRQREREAFTKLDAFVEELRGLKARSTEGDGQ